jgi:putative N6-adenine-specific DNA methylase
MSLEKRIKRHISGRRQDFFAVTLPGFEGLCKDELAAVSETIAVTEIVPGGVSFGGRISDLYLAGLHARTPVRLLMRLARARTTNFRQLERLARNIAWDLYLPQGVLPACQISAHHSRLYHSGAIAGHMEAGIAAHWSNLGLPPMRTKAQTLYVRLDHDTATLSLDACGAPLFRRGLKPHAARAPLRETTAAGILRLAGYRPEDHPEYQLLDPMCGSGTFSLEAALMAKAIPPGFFREFAFMQWPCFRPQQWAHLKKTAGRAIRDLKTPVIRSSDIDSRAIDALRDCIGRNRLDDAIALSHADFFDLQPGSAATGKGLIVLNPPYGKRLSTQGDTERQFKDIAAKLKADFKGWQAALLVPQRELAAKLNLPLESRRIQHGGLDLTLMTGRI